MKLWRVVERKNVLKEKSSERNGDRTMPSVVYPRAASDASIVDFRIERKGLKRSNLRCRGRRLCFMLRKYILYIYIYN